MMSTVGGCLAAVPRTTDGTCPEEDCRVDAMRNMLYNPYPFSQRKRYNAGLYVARRQLVSGNRTRRQRPSIYPSVTT